MLNARRESETTMTRNDAEESTCVGKSRGGQETAENTNSIINVLRTQPTVRNRTKRRRRKRRIA